MTYNLKAGQRMSMSMAEVFFAKSLLFCSITEELNFYSIPPSSQQIEKKNLFNHPFLCVSINKLSRSRK